MEGKRKVSLRLVGLDGNAFNLMAHFKRQAQREGWSSSEIDTVLTECRSGDYDHLLCTLMDHCEDPDDDDEEEDEEEEEEDVCVGVRVE